MTLREEILGDQGEKESARKIAMIFKKLTEDEAAELRELLDDEDVNGTSIGRVLRRRGFDISDRAIQRYRRDRWDFVTK